MRSLYSSACHRRRRALEHQVILIGSDHMEGNAVDCNWRMRRDQCPLSAFPLSFLRTLGSIHDHKAWRWRDRSFGIDRLVVGDVFRGCGCGRASCCSVRRLGKSRFKFATEIYAAAARTESDGRHAHEADEHAENGAHGYRIVSVLSVGFTLGDQEEGAWQDQKQQIPRSRASVLVDKLSDYYGADRAREARVLCKGG